MTLQSSTSIRSRAVAHLAQGMRAHPQQERLVALAGAEDADIGPGGRGQEPAGAVEGLGADGRAPGGVALVRRPRKPRAPVLAHEIDAARIGLEGAVEGLDVARPERVAIQLGGHVVPEAAVRPVGVRHVAGRLLEIRHEAAPLEHLGQEVRGALAGQVDAPELRHRVVPVVAQHALVERLGPPRCRWTTTSAPRRPGPRTRRGRGAGAISPSASSARTARP